MRDVIKSYYDRCPVGGTATAVPDPALGETVESFQTAWDVAKTMSESGLIHINSAHRESQTGKELIDAITFVRMK